MKVPVIDIGECDDCEACLDICPSVFRRNDLGHIQVVDLPEYPEHEVEECMKNCRCQCISWEEV